MAQRSRKACIAAQQHQLPTAQPQLFDAGAMPSAGTPVDIDNARHPLQSQYITVGIDANTASPQSQYIAVGIDANTKGLQSQYITVGIDANTANPQSQYITVGIDEAGRGCLAGPVVAAAVVLPSHYSLPLLNDSKALSAQQRDTLAPQIKAIAISWSVGLSWPREIEKINILQATFHAMARAVHGLGIQPNMLLVDGNKRIPPLVLARFCKGEQPKQQAIIGGDALIPAISAASILAKTYRDHLMVFFHRRYPAYAFDAHKGYGTKAHMQALITHGPCPLHRLTFAGVLPPQEAAPKVQTQGKLC